MKPPVPDSITRAPLYPPGMPLDEVKRRYGFDRVVKLNANENNLGPSPLAVQAVAEAAASMHRYPDNGAFTLRQKLSEKLGLSPEQLVLGNGSNELVQFIMMTFLLQGGEVITGRPTFSLYRLMGNLLGGTVVEVPLRAFTYDLEEMARHITARTRLIVLCNPNNPTGTCLHTAEVSAFLEQVPEEVVVIVDEAYREFVIDPDCFDGLDPVRRGRNVIVLRTFSKAYALAGLRIGYGAGPAELVGYLERVREPFNASAAAQVAACAALDDSEHLKKTLAGNRAGMDYLCASLERLGISCVPSQANFVLVHLGEQAGHLAERMLRAGVLVRHTESFGLPEHVRVTVGLPEENQRFLEVLSALRQEM